MLRGLNDEVEWNWNEIQAGDVKYLRAKMGPRRADGRRSKEYVRNLSHSQLVRR